MAKPKKNQNPEPSADLDLVQAEVDPAQFGADQSEVEELPAVEEKVEIELPAKSSEEIQAEHAQHPKFHKFLKSPKGGK